MKKICNFLSVYRYLIALLTLLLSLILFVLLANRLSIANGIAYACLISSVVHLIINYFYCHKEDVDRKGVANLLAIIFNAVCSIIIFVISVFFYVPEIYYIHVIINTISFVVLFLDYQFIKDSIIQKTNKPAKYFDLKSLSPIDNVENSLTIDALEEACNNPNNFNIALDGVYGSGKSSVLKSYFKKTKNYHILNISFANFKDKDETEKDNVDLERVMNTIYEEVLVHYVKKPNYFLSIIVLLLISIIGFIINYTFGNISFDLTMSVSFSILLSSLFVVLTVIFSTIKRGKIGLGDYSLEMEVSSDSIEMRKIQLINLVKKYNKEVIFVIEDLDRFKNVNIYSSFRELNFVLNQRLANRVIFVYALDTSVFNNAEERVKFFDMIIPVIPVAARENISNKLTEEIKDNIDYRLIYICSACIDNMRMINNISNEYKITKQHFLKINEEYYKESLNKLFAMVAFKNLFPKQYIELFEEKNFLDSIFDKIMNCSVSKVSTQTNFLDYIDSEITRSPSSVDSIVKLNKISYEQLLSILSDIILIKDSSKPLQFDIKSSKIEVANNKEKRKLVEFIIQNLSLGYINLDYVEYLSPAIFNKDDYQDNDEYFADLEIRKDIFLNKSNHYDSKFNNAYFVCKSLHHKCFSFNSIINYSLISLIFDNIYFANKKSIFVNAFLSKIDKNNTDLKRLIFDFINNYSFDPISHSEFLKILENKLEFYGIFNKKEDVSFLAKYINIVSINDNQISLKITSYINQTYTLKELIRDNPVEFYSNLDEKYFELFLKNISNTNYNFTSASWINHMFLKNNKFVTSVESLNNWFNEKKIIDNKIETLICEIRNVMEGDQRTKDIVIKMALNNIANSKEQFCEEMIILKSIYDITRDISLTNKLALNNLVFKDYYITDVPVDTVIHMILNKRIPFSEKFMNQLNNSRINLEVKTNYVMQHIDEIVICDNVKELIDKAIFDECFQKFKMESDAIKFIKDIYGIFPTPNTLISKENMLIYASKYDLNFDEVPISYLFTCTNDEVLSIFAEKNSEEFYYKKLTAEHVRYPNVSGLDKFIKKCLPSFEVINGTLKNKNG